MKRLARPGRTLRTASVTALGLLGFCLMLTVVAVVLMLINRMQSDVSSPWFAQSVSVGVVYPVVGALILQRYPRNTIGWLFCTVGISQAACAAASEYSVYSLVTSAGAPPGGAWAVWVSDWTWPIGELLGTTFLLLLFPRGTLPPGFWRPICVGSALGLLLLAVMVAVRPGPMLGVTPGVPMLPNPIGIASLASISSTAIFLAYVLLGIGTLAGVLHLLARYEQAQELERHQLKWVALGACPTAAAVLVDQVSPGVGVLTPVGQVFMSLALATLPLSVGVAILRYRLYAIDLILNRAAVYGAMTLILGLAFIAVSGLVQITLELTTGHRSDILPPAMGLGVALTFQPLRRRVQAGVDHVLPAREQRVLFFTDIVGSTERLAEVGDAQWRTLLDQYRSAVRRELKRSGGVEMHIAGDSFFATFTDPLRAVHCAQALALALHALGLPSRFGMHWGTCEMRGEEVSGLNVWAAARVMSVASAGEIVVSDAMRDVLADASLPLQNRGMHKLKGLPGQWRLHALPPQ